MSVYHLCLHELSCFYCVAFLRFPYMLRHKYVHITFSIPQYNLMDATVSIYSILTDACLLYPRLTIVIRKHEPVYWLDYLAGTGIFTPYSAVGRLIREWYEWILSGVRDQIQLKLLKGQPMQSMDGLNLIVRNILGKIFALDQNDRTESHKDFDVGPFLQSWEKRLIDPPEQESKLSTLELQAIYVLKVFMMEQNQGPPDRPFLTPQHFNTFFEDYYASIFNDHYYEQQYRVHIKEKIIHLPDYKGKMPTIAFQLEESCGFQEVKMEEGLKSAKQGQPPDVMLQLSQKEKLQSMSQAVLGPTYNKNDDQYSQQFVEIQSCLICEPESSEQSQIKGELQVSPIQGFKMPL